MKLFVPERDTLLANIPIFADVKPLNRPRADKFGGIYQPLKNQHELFQALKNFSSLRIDEPVFVDVTINWPRAKRNTTPHVIARNRGDVDNLAKAINDALVKVKILADDMYIVGQTVTKAWGSGYVASVSIWSVCVNTAEVIPCSPYARTNSSPSMPPFPISQPAKDV